MSEAQSESAISDLLDRIPLTRGKQRVVTEVLGGLTNQSYRVQVDSLDLLVRVFAKDVELFGIDREVEYRNTKVAALAGVAPEVLAVYPELGVLVSAHVPGRTLTPADLTRTSTRVRVVNTLRRLHSSPEFQGTFDVSQFRADYLGRVRELGLRLPDGYLHYLPNIEKVEQLLASSVESPVPCHNDLVAANMIDSGERVWLVDFEFAAMNEASFDLANMALGAELGDETVAELVAEYWGDPDRSKLARLHAWMVVATFAWVPWAAIQDASLGGESDFVAWARPRYERAVASLDSREFESLLQHIR